MSEGAWKRVGIYAGATGGVLSVLWKVVPLVWALALDPLTDKINNLNERLYWLEHPGQAGPPPAP